MNTIRNETILPGIDWADVARRHESLYAGKTGGARLAIEQVTAAWNKTAMLRRHEKSLAMGPDRESEGTRLELAARAEDALRRYWALARALDLDASDPDAMAEVCRRADGFRAACRAARWSCPPHGGTLAEYRWLVGLLEERAKILREQAKISSR